MTTETWTVLVLPDRKVAARVSARPIESAEEEYAVSVFIPAGTGAHVASTVDLGVLSAEDLAAWRQR